VTQSSFFVSLSLTIVAGVLTSTVWSQKYSVLDHLHDIHALEDIEHAQREGDYVRALQVSTTFRNRSSPNLHLAMAKAASASNRDSYPWLDSAFASGLKLEWLDTTEVFFKRHREKLLSAQRAQFCNEINSALFNKCMAIIQADQQLNMPGSSSDLSLNAANLAMLDSIIARSGWPSCKQLGLPGVGVACILAHQEGITKARFMHYADIITELCERQQEDWTVGLFVLQQRIRKYGRDRPDTLYLTVHDSVMADSSDFPMLASISERLVSNGHKRIWLIASSISQANVAIDFIIGVAPHISMDPATLDYLIMNNFDHPAPLTKERFEITVDPNLPHGMLLYQMN
jgi:hypothetical protein